MSDAKPHTSSWLTEKTMSGKRRLALRIVYQGVLLSCVLTGLAFWGQHSWLLDLSSHFRMQYFVIQMLGLMILGVAGARFRWMAPVVLCAGINLGLLLPFLTPSPAASPAAVAGNSAAETPVIRVLHINVLRYADDYDGVARVIRQSRPDILSLQEMDEKWQEALPRTGALEVFPNSYRPPGSQIAFYSRLPLLEATPIREWSEVQQRMAALHARLLVGDTPISILTLHPPAPINAAYAGHQRTLFERIISLFHSGDLEPDVLVVGDLNTTPFSWPYRHLTRETGLRNFRLHRGYLPTWPSFAPMCWIPIDHVLMSDGWEVLDARVGPIIGSDHMPVQVDLRLKTAEPSSP